MSGGVSERVLATAVARRYYLHNQTKSEIALQLRINRFKVARLLEIARATGIVRITLNDTDELNTGLSEQLRRHLGLKRALVVNGDDRDDAATRNHLGVITAALLDDIVTKDDVVGIGWARTVLCMADHLLQLSSAEIVQLTGALGRRDVATNIVELVDRLTLHSGCDGYSFYAPLFVSDPEAVEAMRRQPEVAAAFDRFSAVTKAVVGIGSWQPPLSTLHDALTADERATLLRHGVLADLSGTFIDSAGEPLSMPMNRQAIGISAEQLRNVPDVIGIAYGPEKADAVRVAVTAGYVDTLVTTAAVAQQLLGRPRSHRSQSTGHLQTG